MTLDERVRAQLDANAKKKEAFRLLEAATRTREWTDKRVAELTQEIEAVLADCEKSARTDEKAALDALNFAALIEFQIHEMDREEQ